MPVATRDIVPVERRPRPVGEDLVTGFMRSGAWRDERLEPLRAKVLRGERLSIDEGELLFTTPDIWSVCELADAVRRRLHGNVAYYNINRHINYTNVCALSCKFCAFYRKRGEEGAYEMDVSAVVEEARKAAAAGATELHIVGGLHPYAPFSYYTDMLSKVREAVPRVNLKAFTAVELVHLARVAKVYKNDDRKAGLRWVLSELKQAGLGSLPGGGAEVFDDRVHDEAFKGKIRSDVWLDVHRVAHELGLNSNATMLYGHVENRRERLVHMDMLRRVQDESLARLGYEGIEAPRHRGIENEEEASPVLTLTRPGVALPTPSATGHSGGYFQTIIPLPFFPDESELEHLPGPSGLENLRTLAVSRLMLDNFPHVKAFWIMQTLSMAQLMLQCGADDVDGTVVWYDITKVGGTDTHQEQGVHELCRAIREAGYEPVERDTLYRRVVRGGGAGGGDWHIEHHAPALEGSR
ncbi:MAG: radical SAM protein [Phycisphaerales bacterium]